MNGDFHLSYYSVYKLYFVVLPEFWFYNYYIKNIKKNIYIAFFGFETIFFLDWTVLFLKYIIN